MIDIIAVVVVEEDATDGFVGFLHPELEGFDLLLVFNENDMLVGELPGQSVFVCVRQFYHGQPIFQNDLWNSMWRVIPHSSINIFISDI